MDRDRGDDSGDRIVAHDKIDLLRRETRGGMAVPIFAFLSAVCLAVAGLAFESGSAAPSAAARRAVAGAAKAEAVELPAVHESSIMDRKYFDDAYAKAASSSPIAAPAAVRGLTLPHHLLAASLIAGAVESLAASGQAPKRVVIVGPDHLGRAKSPAIVSEAAWETPYGIVMPDSQAIAAFESATGVAPEEKVFDEDISIAALMPFVARSFPGALVMPIMVNSRLSPEQADRLAAAIPAGPGTLVIASVDFSHYQTSRVAGLHDLSAESVLAAGDAAGLDSLDVDSPRSLRILLAAMARAGASRSDLLARSDSGEELGAPSAPETTSHAIVSFSDGAAAPDGSVTMLAVGDMMFDREVRAAIAKGGDDWPFAAIRGEEDRFFRGLDLTVGNLEGAISPRLPPEKENDFAFDPSVAATLARYGFDAVSLANNHTLDQGRAGADSTAAALDANGIGHFGDQVRDDGAPWTATVRGREVAFLGWDAAGRVPDEATMEKAVRAAKAGNDLVVVMMHWGEEYRAEPTAYQRELGRKLIEWGADAVIGSHPHVIEGMEVWQGKPIFWSLGNFVFDQDWSAETERGLAVGLDFGAKGAEVRLFPVSVIRGQAKLLSGDAESKALADFAARSDLDPALRVEAAEGIIDIDNAVN